MEASSHSGTKPLKDGDFIVIEYGKSIKSGVYHIIDGNEFLAYLADGRFMLEELNGDGVKHVFVFDEGDYRLGFKYEIERRYDQFMGRKATTGNKLKSFLNFNRKGD